MSHRLGALVLALMVPGGSMVAAHHSQAGFDRNDEPIVLEGTVAEWRWRNPHVLLFWDVTDDNGETVRWVGQFSSIVSTIARGLNKNSFKPGEAIVLTGIKSRAGGAVMRIQKIERSDGTFVEGFDD